MSRKLARLGLLALLVAALFPLAPAAYAQTNIFTDFPSFDAATGPLTEIDFETSAYDVTVSSLLTLNGVTFTDPFELRFGFCSSPTCQPDPDNPSGGNVVLSLNAGATMDFPARTGGVMLVVEGLGDVPYSLRVTDFGGNSITATGQGVLFGTEFLGFTSNSGIQRIEVVQVGPTPDCPQSPCGPLPLAAILVELNDPDVTLKVWSDSVGDVAASQGDITYGSAYVSGGVVDLRLQFVGPPFSTAESQHITWCLDTDQNAATGDACGFSSSAGADQAFTLSGGPYALSGDDFSLGGLLAGVDPCAVGSFNWDTNMLRLVLPTSWLSDDGSFNYAVRSQLSGSIDQAPNSVDFRRSGRFFTSGAGEFPFSGSPLCSFKQDTSLTITPQQAGHAHFFPHSGTGWADPTSGIQSMYFKTTATNRDFRRGLFEFALPEIQKPIVKASLVYQDDLRVPYADPVPTTVHELSYYQPSDLVISMADYSRPATFLSSVETDWNWPQHSFAVDITDQVRQFQGDTIGFRIKLAVDPDYDQMGDFGWAFGSSNFRPPQVVVEFVDAQTTLTPTLDSTLIYTDAQGIPTSVFVPANTVTQTTELLYTEQAASAAPDASSLSALHLPMDLAAPVYSPAQGQRLVVAADLPYQLYLPVVYSSVPANLIMVGRPFTLDGYRDGTFTPGSILQKPISVTLRYTDAEAAGAYENSLTLSYWNGSRWMAAACGPYARYPDENRLVVPVCYLDEFSLFGVARGR